MSDYVTGGRVTGPEPRVVRNFRQRHPMWGKILYVTTSVGSGLLLGFVIFPLLMGPTLVDTQLQQSIQLSSQKVDHALARGTTLSAVVTNQRKYVDASIRGAVTTITAGSCGTTTNNAYTLTLVKDKQHVAVFTTRGDTTLTGDIADKTTILREVCAR